MKFLLNELQEHVLNLKELAFNIDFQKNELVIFFLEQMNVIENKTDISNYNANFFSNDLHQKNNAYIGSINNATLTNSINDKLFTTNYSHNHVMFKDVVCCYQFSNYGKSCLKPLVTFKNEPCTQYISVSFSKDTQNLKSISFTKPYKNTVKHKAKTYIPVNYTHIFSSHYFDNTILNDLSYSYCFNEFNLNHLNSVKFLTHSYPNVFIDLDSKNKFIDSKSYNSEIKFLNHCNGDLTCKIHSHKAHQINDLESLNNISKDSNITCANLCNSLNSNDNNNEFKDTKSITFNDLLVYYFNSKQLSENTKALYKQVVARIIKDDVDKPINKINWQAKKNQFIHLMKMNLVLNVQVLRYI